MSVTKEENKESHHATSGESVKMKLFLADENATARFARELAPWMDGISFITLTGGLGAGKTTFARALIQALGFSGRVKSPTYTLVESYPIGEREVFHFDLYRLADPEELEYLGLDDYFSGNALCLVEWADKGEGMLPAVELDFSFEPQGEGRLVEIRGFSAQADLVINGFR